MIFLKTKWAHLERKPVQGLEHRPVVEVGVGSIAA